MTEGILADQVRQRAYEIWLSEGCPHGRDHIHWVRAEAEFRERLTRRSSAAPRGFREPRMNNIPRHRADGRSGSAERLPS